MTSDTPSLLRRRVSMKLPSAASSIPSTRVQNDALLAPVFDGRIAASAWPGHLSKMCDFWSSVLLKSGRYEGRPLPPHLALGAEAGEAQFARWLALFRPTAIEVLPPEAAQQAIAQAERMAHSFRLAIAFHSGEDTTRILLAPDPKPGTISTIAAAVLARSRRTP